MKDICLNDTFLNENCFVFCREFGRWKVNNLAVERRNFLGSPLPLAPEFFRNIRLLGRRPTLQQITENLIKKYGTHFLLSATLGGRADSWKYWGRAKSAGHNCFSVELILLQTLLGWATLSVDQVSSTSLVTPSSLCWCCVDIFYAQKEKKSSC